MGYKFNTYTLLADARIPRHGVKRRGEKVEMSEMAFYHLPILIRRKLKLIESKPLGGGGKKTTKKKKVTAKNPTVAKQSTTTVKVAKVEKPDKPVAKKVVKPISGK